jgi:hypothetical protein
MERGHEHVAFAEEGQKRFKFLAAFPARSRALFLADDRAAGRGERLALDGQILLACW